MIIQVNTRVKDCERSNNQQADPVLKASLENLLKEKNENCDLNWLDDGTVELNNVSSMTLHSFALRAEALGKKVNYHKKTILEIV